MEKYNENEGLGNMEESSLIKKTRRKLVYDESKDQIIYLELSGIPSNVTTSYNKEANTIKLKIDSDNSRKRIFSKDEEF